MGDGNCGHGLGRGAGSAGRLLGRAFNARPCAAGARALPAAAFTQSVLPLPHCRLPRCRLRSWEDWKAKQQEEERRAAAAAEEQERAMREWPGRR